MELEQIVKRFTEGLVYVDANTDSVTTGNRRRNRQTQQLEPGTVFLQGVKTMREPQFVSELVDWWTTNYPKDFAPIESITTSVPYPEPGFRGACDLVLSSDGEPLDSLEWAIEVKHISFCGDNGKRNDFAVQKMLSPYQKDRSLIHDIKRLQKTRLARRKAVIGYCFNYNFDSLTKMEHLHYQYLDRISNIRNDVCAINDPINGEMNIHDTVQFANEIFTFQNLVTKLVTENFFDANRHPCGGDGTIFAWEITPINSLNAVV